MPKDTLTAFGKNRYTQTSTAEGTLAVTCAVNDLRLRRTQQHRAAAAGAAQIITNTSRTQHTASTGRRRYTNVLLIAVGNTPSTGKMQFRDRTCPDAEESSHAVAVYSTPSDLGHSTLKLLMIRT
jgi:hypothetical protein